MKVQKDRHHVLHLRREWSLRPETAELRETPQLIPLIDREVHEELHRVSPPVPLLSYYVMKNTVARFEPQATTLATIDDLMISIEQAAQHERTHRLERQLAAIAIETLDLQRGILRGNVYELTKL